VSTKKKKKRAPKRGRMLILGARLLRDDKKGALTNARRVFRAFNGGVLDVGVTFVHDIEMRALNKFWRKKDEPTDVLSFPLDEEGLWGDLVISVDTARRQARAHEHDLATEVAVLVAHGLVHLAGLDHERSDSEAREMRAAEQTLLATAKIDVRAGLVERAH
jgi:probable rRNA maturation factor